MILHVTNYNKLVSYKKIMINSGILKRLSAKLHEGPSIHFLYFDDYIWYISN